MTENSVKNKNMAKIVDKEQKKAEILDAAVRVLGRKGIAGTKIQDIADEAGIGKGTIYLYFRNKEEVLTSILERHVSSGSVQMQESMCSSVPSDEKVKSLLSGIVAASEERKYPPGLQLEMLSVLMREEGDKAFQRGLVEFRDMLADLLREVQGGTKTGTVHTSLSTALIALIHGMLMLKSVDEQAFPIVKTIEDAVLFIVEALKTDVLK